MSQLFYFIMEFKFNSYGILSREKGNINILKDMIRRNVEATGSTCDSGFLLWLSENCISVVVKKTTNTHGICSAGFTCKRPRWQNKFRWGFCVTVLQVSQILKITYVTLI